MSKKQFIFEIYLSKIWILFHIHTKTNYLNKLIEHFNIVLSNAILIYVERTVIFSCSLINDRCLLLFDEVSTRLHLWYSIEFRSQITVNGARLKKKAFLPEYYIQSIILWLYSELNSYVIESLAIRMHFYKHSHFDIKNLSFFVIKSDYYRSVATNVLLKKKTYLST